MLKLAKKVNLVIMSNYMFIFVFHFREISINSKVSKFSSIIILNVLVNNTILHVDFHVFFLVLRQMSKSSKADEPICFFCNESSTAEKGPLHLVQSYRLDQRVRRCANILEDSLLHAKLQNGDMIAQDAAYHKACLSNVYRSASNKQLGGNFSKEQRKLCGIAFGEVVAFMEETLLTSTDEIPTFKLSDLIKLYNTHLSDLGVTLETRIHSTRFKNRLLAQFEDLSAYNDKKEVILVFNQDVGEAIATAAEMNYDDDGYILAKAANIIRRYVKSYKICIINKIG